MRCIEKRREPKTVTETKCATTTNLSRTATARDAFNQIDKGAVREQLVHEQGGLCAFCIRGIDAEAKDQRGEPLMKIAHRMPIAVNPNEALNWQNLLGSCDGGQRYEGAPATCDCAQGSEALTVDPTQQGSVQRLDYEHGDREGLFITSDDPVLRLDVVNTLALNTGHLPALREATWKAFRELCKRKGPKGYGKPVLRQYFPVWLNERSHRGRLPPFLGVVEKMLQR